MASIKQLTDRKFKITISNGYRPNGKKICKAKTITVPDSVKPRGIPQYVAHEAEELERLVKSGFAEDRDTTFEAYASRWLERQVKYAPGTLASYRRMLERVYPYIGAIKLGELRPMALEMILSRLVDTFFSRISLTMLPVPNPHNTVCVLSWEEARHWQSRSSGYSSS